MSRLFLPGWGAPGALYRPGLPAGWDVVEAPGFGEGGLERHLDRLLERLRSERGGVVLAGHSMGAALAVLAASTEPRLVERLVLLAPAGLPLTKPIGRSVQEFARQVAGGVYPAHEARRAVAATLAAPRAALRLAREVRALDLRPQLAALAEAGVACQVVAADDDTLTPVAHCRTIAALARASYVELRSAGGHMWMVANPALLAGHVG